MRFVRVLPLDKRVSDAKIVENGNKTGKNRDHPQQTKITGRKKVRQNGRDHELAYLFSALGKERPEKAFNRFLL